MKHPLTLTILLLPVMMFFQPYSANATWPPNGWAYWLQDISLGTLTSESPNLVVMDYSSTGGESGEWTAQEIASLHDAGCVVVAYFSIGEAENYRYYWQNSWVDSPPAWLGPVNPDWAGNYKVRFWMSDWKDILFGVESGDKKSYLDRIIDQGFDGIYLDIVDAYYYWSEEAPVGDRYAAAADSMVGLIAQLKSYAVNKAMRPFLVIPQNGEWIIEDCSSGMRTVYFASMDGIAVEDVFHPGDADEDNAWNPRQDSIDGPLADILAEDKFVLSVDYLTNQTFIDNYLSAARTEGYIPLATVRDLGEYHYYSSESAVSEMHNTLPSNSTLTAYPNPFNGTVQVTLRNVGQGSILLELFNLTGQRLRQHQIMSRGNSTVRVALDLQNLPSGTYLLRAGEQSRKITLLR